MNVIGTARPFTKTSYGAVTAYTMGFVSNEGEQALINHFSDFNYKKCTRPPFYDMIYDVKLRLDHFYVKEITDFHDETYGNVVFTYAKAGTKEKNVDQSMWSKSRDNAIKVNKGDKLNNVNQEELLFTGLTYEEITNFKVYVKARIYDKELIGQSKFTCNMCDTPLADDYYRRERTFNANTPNYITSINSLVMGAPYKAIKLDTDSYFGHTMKEGSGEMHVMLQLMVKAR
jgi:hypothetical protein